MLNHLLIQLLILSVFLCALQGYKFLLAPKLRVSSRRGVFRGLSSSLRDEGFHQEKSDVSKGPFHEEENVTKGSCVTLPRLHANAKSLSKWIVRHGGVFTPEIIESRDGWHLRISADASPIQAGDVLIRVPKDLCIHSDPARMARGDLLENTQALMNSLSQHHWRARLAIALLSERVRSKSNYRSYLRNLPFEFWGLPVFFSTGEFALMQDYALMQKTKDRCKFMSEFADSVLLPLHGSPRDPFSGNSADVNAFGWGFASASSRALREASMRVEGSEAEDRSGAVMVPGIDLANHSYDPTCEVVETVWAGEGGEETPCYEMRALVDIPSTVGEAPVDLTISYGQYSNDVLLADYGFTVPDNPHDDVKFAVDGPMIDTARVVMGQSKESILSVAGIEEQKEVLKKSRRKHSVGSFSATGEVLPSQDEQGRGILLPSTARYPLSCDGSGTLRYNENFLSIWQVYWLKCLRLTGTGRDYEMCINTGQTETRARSNGPVDSRLWAFLRVLYSRDEQSLLDHGYTPFTLGSPGSMLDYPTEATVVKTLVGLMGVMLGGYPTDIESDVALMQSGDEDLLLESTTSATSQATERFSDGKNLMVASNILFDKGGSIDSDANGLTTRYGAGPRYLDDLLVDSTTNDGLSITERFSEGNTQPSESGSASETAISRIRRILRDILQSNDQINRGILLDKVSAEAAAVAALIGVREGQGVHEIANAADAAAEAATLRESSLADGSGGGDDGLEGSLEDMIVKKMKNELEQGENGVSESDGDEEGGGEEEEESMGIDMDMEHRLERARVLEEETVQERKDEDKILEEYPVRQMHFTIDSSEASYVDIGADGSISPNVRQAMLYRIRKKKGMRKVIEALGDTYSRLQGVNITKNTVIPPLLPSEEVFSRDNKEERTRKITDLVAEVIGKEGSMEARGDKLLSAATKLSSKWEDRGLEL
jgi:hypothetical protein